MNHRAGGNQNGRMTRSSRSESSDLVAMKALAAAARSAPAAHERGPELSGMMGRHSVVGARVDDRAPLTAGLSWIWLSAGCATVLLPGLLGVWLIARAPSASSAERTPVAVAVPAPAAAVAEPAPPVQIEPMARLPAMVPEAEPPAPAARGPMRYYRHRRSRGLSAAAAAAMAAANGNAPAANAGAAPAGATPAANAAADNAPADSPEPAAADNKAAQADTPADKPKKAVEAAAEDPSSTPPKTVKELRSALARLQNRVVACHQRFQVDGVADVRVAVNPSGTVESASLAGEFEGTPTGDCIVRLVSAASFPSFDGTESVRVSHSFSLE